VAEGGIVGVDDDLRQQGRDRAAGEGVAQLLLEQVADHPLALGSEHVERVGGDLGVGERLEGEQPHLRAVPVRDHELVLPPERRQRLHRTHDVAALDVGLQRLPAPEQGVPAERRDDAHGHVSQRRVTSA
jgi:hypothetical protein